MKKPILTKALWPPILIWAAINLVYYLLSWQVGWPSSITDHVMLNIPPTSGIITGPAVTLPWPNWMNSLINTVLFFVFLVWLIIYSWRFEDRVNEDGPSSTWLNGALIGALIILGAFFGIASKGAALAFLAPAMLVFLVTAVFILAQSIDDVRRIYEVYGGSHGWAFQWVLGMAFRSSYRATLAFSAPLFVTLLWHAGLGVGVLVGLAMGVLYGLCVGALIGLMAAVVILFAMLVEEVRIFIHRRRFIRAMSE